MIEARISHTEENTKRKSGSHSTKYLILDQFRAWKESEGRQASVQTILSTLKALTRNDLLHDFEEFIRNTPFILKKCDPIESISHAHQSFNSSLEYCSSQSNSSLGYGLPPRNTILDNCLPHGSITHKRYEEICYATERLGQGDGEEGNDLNTEPKQLALLPMNDESSKEVVHLARYAESQTMVNEGKSESSSSQTFKSSRSNRETNMKKQNKTKFKRGRKKMPKHLYLSTDSLSIDSFFMMAKVWLDSEVKKFPKDIYEHLVQNTVVEIVNYTRNSEQTIISLKVEEFNKSLPHQTSKETIHSMYAGDTLLIVDDSNYELLLYVNKARKRIVKRLALEEKLDDFFFVSYEGKPLLEKNSSHEMAEGNDMSSDDTQDISVKETSSSSGEEN